MQEQKRDYRTIAIKALKVASAVLAVVAMFFVLNALMSIDWDTLKVFHDYYSNYQRMVVSEPPRFENGDYVQYQDFYKAMNFPLLVDSAKKALYCLAPTPVLYTIATLMEKKK